MRKLVIASAMLLAMSLAGRQVAAAPSGTFRFGEEVKLVTLDPQQHTGGGISYIRPVYETLFSRAPDGSVEPLLATGYKMDGLKVTLTLREGVTFSDGEAFDADAVAANLLRGKKLGILAPLKLVADAKAVDAHTVLVTLAGPDPSFIDDLTLEPGMMIAPKAMADQALDRNPVGTGPFVYDKAASREGQLRVYAPNPHYWNPQAQGLARLEIWEIPDDTARLNALKTGQIDVGIWLSNPQAAIIDRSPGLKLVRNAGGYTYQVIISDRAGTKVPAFADQRVRQAMNYAIDRKAFSRAVEFGLADPAYQPYPKGLPQHVAALENRFAYDPAKARALLAEAGYAKGFAFTMPSIPIFASRLEAIAGFFRAVGITMHIQPVEPGTLARRSRTMDFPATNLVWNTTWDPKYLADYFTSEKADFNPFHVPPTEDLAKLADAGLHATDPAAREAIYHQMIGKIAEQSFIMYVTSTPLLFGLTEKSTKNPTLKFRPGEDTPYFEGLQANR